MAGRAGSEAGAREYPGTWAEFLASWTPTQLGEFTFRFNRRSSRRRGLLFYRLLQQAVIHPADDLQTDHPTRPATTTLPAANWIPPLCVFGGEVVMAAVQERLVEVEPASGGGVVGRWARRRRSGRTTPIRCC